MQDLHIGLYSDIRTMSVQCAHVALFWLLFFWSCLILSSEAIPLQADRIELQRLSPGCHMGSQFYDLHATWTPSLEPQGPMYCIICKCDPIVKKGILQATGKVTCKNVRDRCPSTQHCTSPLTAEGRCCNLCQGQEFTAILTGRRSSKMMSSNTSAVGRGRFTLTSEALYYSLVVDGFESTKSVQLLDDVGNILHEEHKDSDDGEKVCGTWRSLSKTHVRYLQQQSVQIVLLSNKKDVSISGSILPHPAPDKEIFNAILRDDHHTGSGAVAMLDYDVKKKSLDFFLFLRGISLPMDTPSPISLEIYKGRKKLAHTEVDVLGDETQITGSWNRPPKKVLKNLPRSRLTLLVTMVTGKRVRGPIATRRTCNGFHALLSGQFRKSKVFSGAAGFATYDLTKNGKLSYKVKLEGLKSPLNELVVTTPKKRRGKKRHVCNIGTSINVTQSHSEFAGTCRRLKVTDVAKFLRGELEVQVSTRGRSEGLLRGPLVEILHNNQISEKELPTLLSGSTLEPPRETAIAGRSWFAVDDLCVLHYDVIIEGVDPVNDTSLQVTLNAVSKKSTEQVVLDNFDGSVGRGSITNLQRRMFAALHKGAVMVIAESKAHPTGIIGGKVRLPNNCHGSKNKGNFVDVGVLHDNAIIPDVELKKCSYEGVWYGDGESWPRSSGHSCGMCSCKRGHVECHDGVCPKVDCEDPITPPRECCPQCIDDGFTGIGSCYYEGDQSYHKYGTVWHPYVPQLGYSTCAVCRCGEAGPDDVNCTRLNCPPLDCPLQEAVRVNPHDCCQVCPEKPSTLPALKSATLAPIEAAEMPMTDDRSCTSQGNVYSHGQRFHPRVMPFGYLPCYTCLCQNGNIGCARTVCPELFCAKKIVKSDGCCPSCEE